MEPGKAAFFDTQIHSDWASAPYTVPERRRLQTVLSSAGLKKGMKVLEPGCGVGRLTEMMAREVGPEGFVLAVDMSKKMVEECTRRMGDYGNSKVIHAAMEDSEVSPQGYDLVVCHNVFHHFRDKGAALRKLSASLKENGSILIFHFLNLAQINDRNRKISPAVLNDTMPSTSEMEALMHSAGMRIHSFSDDVNGYTLEARMCAQCGWQATSRSHRSARPGLSVGHLVKGSALHANQDLIPRAKCYHVR